MGEVGEAEISYSLRVLEKVGCSPIISWPTDYGQGVCLLLLFLWLHVVYGMPMAMAARSILVFFFYPKHVY